MYFFRWYMRPLVQCIGRALFLGGRPLMFEGVNFLQSVCMSVVIPGVSGGTCLYVTVVFPLNVDF